MELRGDVRRGEFVEGDGPIQYAEPEVVEELRRMQNEVKEAASNLESSFRDAVAKTQGEFDSIASSVSGDTSSSPTPSTDWDRIYAVRRQRERIKDRRIEREKELGIKRPKRPFRR